MNLRVFLIVGLTVILASCMTSQPVAIKNAKVEKIEAGKEYKDFAVNYALPRTVIDVKVVAEKTITKPGPFAAYAERFLGVSKVPTREKTEWNIKGIKISTSGERDPGQVYRIISEGESRANRVQLNHEGVLLGVNLPPFGTTTYDMSRIKFSNSGDMVIPAYPDLTIRKHTEPMPDTVYKTLRTDTSFIRLPVLRQQISTKTLVNQAEEAANIIMNLRERKYWLMNGEFVVEEGLIPLPDGPALKTMFDEMTKLEYDYVSLFVGRTMTETTEFEFSYTPNKNTGNESADLFSFSNFSGVLPAGSSNGDPVKIVINSIAGFPGEYGNITIGDNEEQQKGRGLAYRIPGRAEVSIEKAGETLISETFLIAQYGLIQFLPKQLISQPDVMIRMHPELGSIEGIYEK